MVFLLQLILFSLLTVGSAASLHADAKATKIAAAIRMRYDSSLDSLEPDARMHYLIRIWRGTGDSSVIDSMRPLVRDFIACVRADVDSHQIAPYRAIRDSMLAEPFKRKSRKARARADILLHRSDELFMLNLLADLNRMTEFGLDSSFCRPLYSQLDALVSAFDYRPVLLDTAVVRTYGAQVANYVHYLYRLEKTDLRDSLRAVIETVFPDKFDQDLSAAEFGDKVYTLTHLVLAASQYYQMQLPPSEYRWVTDFFEQNRMRILGELTTDMIAEVGLCFLLTGNADNPMVRDCRKLIMKRFNPKRGLIPSERGSTDLQKSEHRNVLAFLLLNWPSELSAGPNLRSDSELLCP